MARTTTCCLNCHTTICVKHLLKICHRCAPIVLKDAAPDDVVQERPVPPPPHSPPPSPLPPPSPPSPLPPHSPPLDEEPRHHLLEPDPQLPEINGVIAELFQEQWPLELGQMEQIEEHLEKQHRVKQTVAKEKEPDLQLREKESACQLPAVIRFNFQDQLPNEDGQLEEIEKEMDQWCTQGETIEKEKEQQQPAERAQLRHSGGPQSRHSSGPQSRHSGGLISTQARTPSTLMIWKAQWENERLAWEREEKQRKREAEQRVLEERAAAVDKRTIELEEESKKLQAKRREEEKAALLLREKKLADALKKLVGHGDEK